MNLSKLDKLSDKNLAEYEKTLTEAYKASLKNIKQEVSSVFEKYSKQGILDLETMSVKDKNKITRLTKLIDRLNNELNSLNRGRPQELASYLTNQWYQNHDFTVSEIEKITGISFNLQPNREIYNSAVSELGKIGLESNANAVKLNIKRAITNAIVKGDSIQTMSKDIQKALETNLNNAVRIARTETTRVVNSSRLEAFTEAEDLGIKMQKRWISAKDDRTRHTHATLDGKTVDNDKPFITDNGNQLMYPGDPMGGASETISCRCTMVYCNC